MDRLKYILLLSHQVYMDLGDKFANVLDSSEVNLEPTSLYTIDNLTLSYGEMYYGIQDLEQLENVSCSLNLEEQIQNYLYELFLIYDAIPEDHFVYGFFKNVALSCLTCATLLYSMKDNDAFTEAYESGLENGLLGSEHHMYISNYFKNTLGIYKKDFINFLNSIKIE